VRGDTESPSPPGRRLHVIEARQAIWIVIIRAFFGRGCREARYRQCTWERLGWRSLDCLFDSLCRMRSGDADTPWPISSRVRFLASVSPKRRPYYAGFTSDSVSSNSPDCS